jgi:uncharacterized protein (TIGR02246 family)
MNASPARSPGIRRFFGSVKLPATMVAASVIMTGLPCAAAAQTSDDSAAVRALVEAYRTTWNQHDPSALATFFTQDADVIMGSDPVAIGWEAIQGSWRDYFARQEPERRVAIDIHRMRLITPAVAVLNVATTTGGRNAQGETLKSRKARGTWVVVRKGDTWRISAMRGMPTEQDRIIRGPGRLSQVERFMRGVYGCDPSVVDALAADSVVLSYPIFEQLYHTPALRGRPAVRSFAEGFCSRWKEGRLTVHESLADGDNVVLVWSFRARFVGSESPGGPAAGEEQAWGGITFYRFDDSGKITAEIGEESTPGPMARVAGKQREGSGRAP